MRQRGIVIEKQAEDVKVLIQDPARTCSGCSGCVRLTPEREQGDYVLELRDARDEYVIGDEVIVEGRMGELVKPLGILYGLPFISLFIGYVLVRLILMDDRLAGLGAVAGLLLGAVVARPLARKIIQGGPQFDIVARACS